MSDAGMMLGFAGLVGALFLGVVAEATMSWASTADDDEDNAGEDNAEAGGDTPHLLDAGDAEGFGDAQSQADPAGRGDLLDWAALSDPEDDTAMAVAPLSAADPAVDGSAGAWAVADAVAEDDGGDETLLLSEVVEGDDLALIDDFDAETDHLVVVYDPELHPDPALTLEPMPDGSGMTVMLDGVPLAEVPGATDLRPEQIQLKPSMPLAA